MSGHDTLIDRYITLFRGNGAAYGSWQGRCIREPLTRDVFTEHLVTNGDWAWIGTYPLLGARGVSYGCIDIDGKDFALPCECGNIHAPPKETDTWTCVGNGGWNWEKMSTLAFNLQTLLAVKDIHAHIERTRNGFHVWVFPETGIAPVADMRRALKAACEAFGYNPKEVNPKSEVVIPGKLGNYVRLPYYGALSPRTVPQPDRYFLDEAGDRLQLEEFLDTVKLTPLAAIADVATLWTPPTRVVADGPPPEDLEAHLQILDGMAYTIWKDGPLEGRDRSNTLAKLAYRCRDTEVDQAVTFAIVKDADRRWGKFADRPDVDEQIANIVDHVYSQV